MIIVCVITDNEKVISPGDIRSRDKENLTFSLVGSLSKLFEYSCDQRKDCGELSSFKMRELDLTRDVYDGEEENICFLYILMTNHLRNSNITITIKHIIRII